MPSHSRTNEHDLIGSRQHRPCNHCIRGAHDTSQQRVPVGHSGDVLGEHDRFPMPASGQHGDYIGRIETVDDGVLVPNVIRNDDMLGQVQEDRATTWPLLRLRGRGLFLSGSVK